MTEIGLQSGDEIRVVAPSARWAAKNERRYQKAQKRLEALGYKVSFGKNIERIRSLGTAALEERISDLLEAYADKRVRAIIALTGGWSANELLPAMDWQLIKHNLKPLIGYSDITVLLNAIYAKTGQVNYLGPNFGTLGYKLSSDYTLGYLDAALCQQFPLRLKQSVRWGVPRRRRSFATKPPQVLQAGKGNGKLLGGNIASLYLLQGTEYMPKFSGDIVLAIEDDDESGKYAAREFDRRLESLLQLPEARTSIKAVLIGRLQPTNRLKMPDLIDIISRKDLKDIPVIADLNFGHTLPMVTLPVGGEVSVKTDRMEIIYGR